MKLDPEEWSTLPSRVTCDALGLTNKGKFDIEKYPSPSTFVLQPLLAIYNCVRMIAHWISPHVYGLYGAEEREREKKHVSEWIIVSSGWSLRLEWCLTRMKRAFVFAEITCPFPTLPKSGKILENEKTAGHKRRSKPHKVGTLVRFSCLPGHQLIGEASIICTENGTWSHQTPLCKYIREKRNTINSIFHKAFSISNGNPSIFGFLAKKALWTIEHLLA